VPGWFRRARRSPRNPRFSSATEGLRSIRHLRSAVLATRERGRTSATRWLLPHAGTAERFRTGRSGRVDLGGGGSLPQRPGFLPWSRRTHASERQDATTRMPRRSPSTSRSSIRAPRSACCAGHRAEREVSRARGARRGINLTHLYTARCRSSVPARDLIVNKIYRGLARPMRADDVTGTTRRNPGSRRWRLRHRRHCHTCSSWTRARGRGRFHELPRARKASSPAPANLRLPRLPGTASRARRSCRASVRMRQREGRLICDEVSASTWTALITPAS